MIIDYDYYHSHGGSKIPQNEFDKYCTIASGIMKSYMMNRDYTIYETLVKNTTCIVVDLVYDKENLRTYETNSAMGISTSVSSERVGEYSVNYATYNTNDIANVLSNYNSEIDTTIYDSLGWTGLLNRSIGVIR